MHKAISLGTAVALAGLICGCGGGGSGVGTSGNVSTINPLTGTYGGNGNTSVSADAIDANIGVSPEGILCGTLVDGKARTKTLLGGDVSVTGYISNGSYEVVDQEGKTVGTGSLTGQINGMGSGPTNPQTVSVQLTAAVGATTSTYTFTSLQNLANSVKAKQRRLRKKGSPAAAQAPS